MMYRGFRRGWYGESHRHYLARMGVKTSYVDWKFGQYSNLNRDDQTPASEKLERLLRRQARKGSAKGSWSSWQGQKEESPGPKYTEEDLKEAVRKAQEEAQKSREEDFEKMKAEWVRGANRGETVVRYDQSPEALELQREAIELQREALAQQARAQEEAFELKQEELAKVPDPYLVSPDIRGEAAEQRMSKYLKMLQR